MAARWVGLKRPNAKRNARATARRGVSQTLNDFLHAIGATGVLVIAAAMNFALYPDAIASVFTGQPAIAGFVSEEPVQAHTTAVAPIPVDENEVHLLAATAWGEARSEGEDGMRAVAHVMVNRVGQRFGDDLETVIRAPKQFSAWNLGDPNRPLVQNPERYARGGENLVTWETAQKVAREVLSGQSVDPTHGALFYHTRAISPWWSRYGRGATIIGAHIFYRDVPDQIGARRVRPLPGARTTAIAAHRGASRAGPRAGRVRGVIQHAQPGAADALPAATISAPTVAVAPIATTALDTAAPTTSTF